MQSPSWAADWFAASQEIPRISRNPKVHYRTHKRTPPVASPIQSTYPHPTSWRSILILSTHLRLGLPSGLFPSGFPTKTLYALSPHPYAPHAQPISFFSKGEYTTYNNNHGQRVRAPEKTALPNPTPLAQARLDRLKIFTPNRKLFLSYSGTWAWSERVNL